MRQRVRWSEVRCDEAMPEGVKRDGVRCEEVQRMSEVGEWRGKQGEAGGKCGAGVQ